eukprot:scaffold25922_cov55-Attheya_sp.AAC.9
MQWHATRHPTQKEKIVGCRLELDWNSIMPIVKNRDDVLQKALFSRKYCELLCEHQSEPAQSDGSQSRNLRNDSSGWPSTAPLPPATTAVVYNI